MRLIVILLVSFLVSASTSYLGNFALSFDAVNDYVLISRTKFDHDLDRHWTIEGWIKASPNQETPQAALFGFPDRHPNLAICGSSNPLCSQGALLLILMDANGVDHAISGSYLITDGEWHHVAATSDNRTISLFVDANNVATMKPEEEGFVFPLPPEDSTEGFQIGGVQMGRHGSHFFTGLIDEVRVWSQARSGADIQRTMGQTILPENGLVYYWRFDEGIGTLVRSKAEIGYGTLGGGIPSAEPQWVISDSPIISIEPDDLSQAEAVSVGTGAFLGVFFTFLGLASGVWMMLFGQRYRILSPIVAYIKKQKVPLSSFNYQQPTYAKQPSSSDLAT